jgi:competence ComEA-like helix-hairpin-helix protein
MRHTMSNMKSADYVRPTEDRQSGIQSFAFVVSVCGCILLSMGFGASSLVGAEPSFEIGLDERVNPNDAPVASLVRLPGIGIGRAEAIVDYRRNLSEQDNSTHVFQEPKDLQEVKGIGPKTVQNINEWLKFE